MKTMKSLLVLVALLLLATACSARNPVGVNPAESPASPTLEPTASPEFPTSASYAPLYFDSEEDLLRVISEVKSKKSAAETSVCDSIPKFRRANPNNACRLTTNE